MQHIDWKNLVFLIVCFSISEKKGKFAKPKSNENLSFIILVKLQR